MTATSTYLVRVFTALDNIDIPCDSLCEVEEILDNAEHEGHHACIIGLPVIRRLPVEDN